MSEQFEKLMESVEKIKEVQRLQYDYFKHLSILSGSSILIIVAFLEKIFNSPNYIIFAIISICCFLLCLLFSIWVLPEPVNVILYISGERIIALMPSSNPNLTEKELQKKRKKSLCKISFFDRATKITFFLGVGMFLLFVFLNFFSEKSPH